MSCIITLDKRADTPVYRQIYTQLKGAVISGELEPDEKLPSIRALASELGIARNTVEAAYRQLQIEGFVESRRGSGFTVQELPAKLLRKAHSGSNYEPSAEIRRAHFDFDLSYGNLAPTSFPVDDWRKLSSEVLSDINAEALCSYGNGHGELELRACIARHLASDRGVTCAPEQIILTSGTQQALELLCRLFDRSKTRVCMENPGFAPARLTFSSLGFKFAYASTQYGSEAYLADVARSDASLVYTTPSHQFPMGTCLDVSSRAKLIEIAERRDAFIIEDNYDSEFRYNSQPVPSLQSIDHAGRVIYVGTFSKALSPALRISYLVLPPKLVARYKRHFAGMRCTVPVVEQQTLRLFMQRGLWEKHLHRACIANRKRHDALARALKETFADRIRTYDGEAGLFMLAVIDNHMTSHELVRSAAQAGVRVSDAAACWANPADAIAGAVLLGFSSATERDIPECVLRLKGAWL